MKVPHLRIVVMFSIAVLIVYGAFSVYVIAYSADAAMKGDVIGTWKSFAVAAVSFWIGSSSAGKARTDEPLPVEVTNQSDKPVPTVEGES